MNFITKKEMKNILALESLDNRDRVLGTAVVNVLSKQQYQSGHIPGSINVPFVEPDVKNFKELFDREKILVVYSRSNECPEAERCAEALLAAGYLNVNVYKGGMREWSSGTAAIERGSGNVREIPIA